MLLAFLPIFILTAVYIGFLIYSKFKANKYYWPITLLYLFLIRSDDFYRSYTLNIDEEQWIICANSVVESPLNWLNSFLLIDFTRMLTILPLTIFSFFTDYINYDHARFLNISMYFFWVYIIYKCVSFIFISTTPLITATFLILFFALSRDYDFISYNSELPAILLMTISIYFFIKTNVSKKNFFYYVVSGFILVLAIVAKEQAFLIVAVLVTLLSSYLLINREYKHLLYFTLGCTISSISLLVLFFAFYSIDDLNYILTTGYEYSQQAVFIVKSTNENLVKLLENVLLSRDYIVFSSVAIVSFFLLIAKNIKLIDFKLNFFLFAITLLLLTSLFTIYRPKNFFLHYNYYLIIPYSFLFAYLIESISIKSWSTKLYVFLFAILFLSKTYANDRRLFYPISKIMNDEFINREEFINKEDALYKCIQKNSKKGDKLLIRGWGLKYYLNSELKRSSRFLYPHFAIGRYSLKEKVNLYYIHDVELFKPDIIIEEFGENSFFLSDTNKTSIKKSSEPLFNLIEVLYTCKCTTNNFKLYKKKSSTSSEISSVR